LFWKAELLAAVRGIPYSLFFELAAATAFCLNVLQSGSRAGGAGHPVLCSTHSGAVQIEAGGRLPVRTGAGGELARHINLGGDVGGECPGAVQGRGLDVGRG